MKKFIAVLIIICGATSGYGQVERKHYIGGHVSYGVSDYSSESDNSTLFGSKSYAGDNYLTIGLDYSYRDSEVFEIGTGISVTFNDMTISSTYWNFGSGSSSSESDDQFFIFSVPLHLKFHFLKYLFVGGGLSLNYHPSKGYTWGVGGNISIGAEYTFRSGLTVSISPEIQSNLLNFASFGDSYGIDKLTQKGISIGLGYKF